MRVVFDTNIFISALVTPGGSGARAMQRILRGKDRLYVSRELVDEVLVVLARKFARDAQALSRTAIFLSELGQLVVAAATVSVLADETDNRILECAIAAGAELVVTGDRAMLELGEFAGVRMISLRDYLAIEEQEP